MTSPSARRLAALREAANVQNFLLRVSDVSAVLDRLEAWNRDRGSALAGRLELGHVGMAGHSFGAVTTQAVSGEALPLGGTRYTDARIKAAVAMSPSSPRSGDPQRAFGGVSIPWLLMTGTRDVAPIGGADVASRLAVYEALPPRAKYELVLDSAEHSAFSDRACPATGHPRPNHTGDPGAQHGLLGLLPARRRRGASLARRLRLALRARESGPLAEQVIAGSGEHSRRC